MKRRSGKNRQQPDYYAKRARKEHFPARSVYKLEAIQKKFGILRKGQQVLDLGCAPGSWLQYAARITGSRGGVTGIDQKPVKENLPAHAAVLAEDAAALAEDAGRIREVCGSGLDVVLSDMAPATSGKKDVDAARSYHLSRAALTIAGEVLQPGGAFVCKIFQGEDFEYFIREVKALFASCRVYKPESTRKESRETYVIGMGKK
ncbi:MAG TPA: RlmE family RNA methyltransferase [Desulfosalsimonadaceae bacterium]|nr:RlmE family RNA methyltransferase [Desulfosalsimonadaceae bacterium]